MTRHPTHTTWQHVLIQIKSPNDLDTCHVKWVPETTFWHKKLNQTLGPFGDSSWHAQPILPKFGGVFCLCTIGPQKGPKVSFDSLCQKVVLGVQTTFQVSKLFGLLICINTSCQVVCITKYRYVKWGWWTHRIYNIKLPNWVWQKEILCSKTAR